MGRTDSLEKILMLGKTKSKRRRGWQRVRWLGSIPSSMDMSLRKFQEIVKDRKAWHAAAHRVSKSQLVTEQHGMRMLSGSVVSTSFWPHGGGSPPDSVHEIFQARILEWLPLPTPGDLSFFLFFLIFIFLLVGG